MNKIQTNKDTKPLSLFRQRQKENESKKKKKKKRREKKERHPILERQMNPRMMNKRK